MDGRLTRHEAWLLTAGALLVVALLARNAPLALLGAGLLAAAATVTLWRRYALARVTYRRTLAEHRAFLGEALTLEIEISNRKLLPLPWLEAEDSLPDALTILDGPGAVARQAGRARLRQLVSLRWYERVRLVYRLRCEARGAYEIGPVSLRAGDPFGFTAREGSLSVFDRVLIYPKVVPLERLGLPAQRPFGQTRDQRRLFQDPTRIQGVRPYTIFDSPRHIDWKATARTQQLQTRQFEPTASHTLMLYVNLASFEGYWWASLSRPLLELAIMTAASVASAALDDDYHVGVATNGAPAGGGEELGILPAGDAEQLVRVLELLARVSLFARTPLERLLASDRARLPFGTTVVIISAVFPESVLEVVRSLASLGHACTLIRLGDSAPFSAPPGIPVYHVPEVAWQEVTSLSPQPARSAAPPPPPPPGTSAGSPPPNLPPLGGGGDRRRTGAPSDPSGAETPPLPAGEGGGVGATPRSPAEPTRGGHVPPPEPAAALPASGTREVLR